MLRWFWPRFHVQRTELRLGGAKPRGESPLCSSVSLLVGNELRVSNQSSSSAFSVLLN